MGQSLSMSTRREITKKNSAEYSRASKKAKGVMPDQLVATTGWSRANARCCNDRLGPSPKIKETQEHLGAGTYARSHPEVAASPLSEVKSGAS